MANEIFKNVTNTGRTIVQTIPSWANATNNNFGTATVSAAYGVGANTIPKQSYISSTASLASVQIPIPAPIVNSVISSVSMSYVIGGSLVRTPTTRLGLNVIREGASAGSLFSAGFQQLPLYNTLGGAAGSYSFTTDQNNLVSPGFHYYVLIQEETGTGFGNIIYSISVTYSLSYT